jgi:hypothetical protein
MKKTKLTLVVNKYFYNMLQRDELEIDYRAIKPYWIKQLVKKKYQHLSLENMYYKQYETNIFQTYDELEFKFGYKDTSPKVTKQLESVRITNGEEMTCMGYVVAFALTIK